MQLGSVLTMEVISELVEWSGALWLFCSGGLVTVRAKDSSVQESLMPLALASCHSVQVDHELKLDKKKR